MSSLFNSYRDRNEAHADRQTDRQTSIERQQTARETLIGGEAQPNHRSGIDNLGQISVDVMCEFRTVWVSIFYSNCTSLAMVWVERVWDGMVISFILYVNGVTY